MSAQFRHSPKRTDYGDPLDRANDTIADNGNRRRNCLRAGDSRSGPGHHNNMTSFGLGLDERAAGIDALRHREEWKLG